APCRKDPRSSFFVNKPDGLSARPSSAEGNSRLDKTPLIGQKVLSVRSFGKQFLVELPDLSIRIHLMMFGSYRAPTWAYDSDAPSIARFARKDIEETARSGLAQFVLE